MSDKERNMLNSPMSRRQALKIMGGLASMAALSACVAPAAPAGETGAAPAAGEAAAPAAAGAKMVVAHREEYFDEMETLFADAVKTWGAENGVEIETTTVAAEAGQDFVPKLLAQVAAGDPPNMVYHIRLVQQLWSQNALEQVSDVVAQTTELYGEPAYGQKTQGLIDGEWYGVPYMMHGSAQFARRSKYEEAGIDPLADIPTWDDRREAALTISKPEEEFYGWGLTVNSGGDATGFIEGVIQSFGGHYTNEDITEVTFNSPETVAAVEWITEIFTSDKYAPMIPPGILSWTDSSNNEAFLAGTIGFTSNAASVYAKAKADGNPIFEDTVALETVIGPIGRKLESGGGGQMLIPRGATHQDLAKQLMLYMVTPEVFLPISLISAGLFLPAYAGYYDMPEVVEAFKADENLARMGKASQGDHPGASWPAPNSPLFDGIASQAVLTDMMAQIIAQGVAPADAVAQAAERIVSIGNEMGLFV